MPIDFYGKVVDFDGQPIANAVIRFTWNDLSPTGSSQSATESDGNGLFSLTNAEGKFLEVEINKDGYFSSRSNPFGFEYAQFSDERFYQPDIGNPIIFRLRKKKKGDPLISREQKLNVSVGASSSIVLDNNVQLQVDLLANPKPKQGPWSMQISVVNGGIQSSVEEFPFSAPTSGYQQSLLLDNNTPKPPAWPDLYEGGEFYFQSGSIYGRIEVEMIPGKSWVNVKSWINASGSTNLESDSSSNQK